MPRLEPDIEQARARAAAFAERFPEVLEIWLVGSRAAGQATSDSDSDFIVLVTGEGELRLSAFDTAHAEQGWGWLLPEDAERLFAPGARCDLMLVEADSDEFKAAGALVFDESDPRALLWERTEREQLERSQ